MAQSKRLKALAKRMTITDKGRAGVRCTVWRGTMKPSGTPVAVFIRNADQIFRGPYATIDQARREGVLSWMIDSPTLDAMKNLHGVECIINAVKENGDLYISHIDQWMDPALAYVPNGTTKRPFGHGLEPLKVLATSAMTYMPGEIDLLAPRIRAKK